MLCFRCSFSVVVDLSILAVGGGGSEALFLLFRSGNVCLQKKIKMCLQCVGLIRLYVSNFIAWFNNYIECKEGQKLK
jgi:hypothetical protein